ncbi:histidinol dehydrogenase [Longimicrobium sp.]|uniref:histidinol dehydrogenase n=1 Tax=Longimicrobium sp. TaxID=2029185 RepID=UPI0039C95912
MAAAASTDDPGLRDAVAGILREVQARGDEALLEYTARFDGFQAPDAPGLRIGVDQLEEAARSIDPDLLGSLRAAAENIRRFHEKQREHGFLEIEADGSILGQRVAPLRRVGIYVPGGRAAYPSSVLMNAIPAAVAGVVEIAMASPTPGGEITPVVLAAAHVAGVTEVLRIGGAQAVGALAFGTDSIGRVDKIVGPGNKWVAEAKRQVFGVVDIDMVAGPSEILVIADETADAVHVAADLIGQAEHDPDAIAWLVTTSAALAERVPAELERLLERNPRRDVARAALEANGAIVLVDTLDDAAAVADLRAPEHLELLVAEPMVLAGRIRNAGAIFLGAHSPEPMGDYFAGPNHVLPTGGSARFASPLGVYDFVKRTSLIGLSAARLRRDAPHVIRLAESEGLFGHAEAVRVRNTEAPQSGG